MISQGTGSNANAAPASRNPRPDAAGLCLSLLILAAVIAALLFTPMGTLPVVDQKAPAQAPFFRAQSIEQEIAALERKVWKEGKDLTPEDFKILQGSLSGLEECRNDLLNGIDSGSIKETDQLRNQRMQVEVWILDVRGLTDRKVQPPQYGGIAIPFHRAGLLLESLKAAVCKIADQRRALPGGYDPEEKLRSRIQLEALADSLHDCLKEYERLDQQIRRPLDSLVEEGARCIELELLGDSTALASQALMITRKLRAELRD